MYLPQVTTDFSTFFGASALAAYGAVRSLQVSSMQGLRRREQWVKELHWAAFTARSALS